MAKNVKNFNGSFGGGGSGTVVTYEEYSLAPQQIQFNDPAEDITSNWKVREVVGAVSGEIDGIKVIKIGNMVNMHIPAFTGTKNGSASEVITIVNGGELPSRFYPISWTYQYGVNAWNNSTFLSAGQNFADIVVNSSNGSVELVARTLNWQGNCGLKSSVTLTWQIE